MAIGNYIVFANTTNDGIVFSPAPNIAGDLAPDQQDLVFSVESTLEVVEILYKQKNPQAFSNYFDQLLKLSQVGLVGPNCQPKLAKRSLDQIRTEITNRESATTKNNYLRKLGYRALWLGLPVLICAFILNYLICKKVEFSCIDCASLISLMLVWTGCMAGVWLSFTITRPIIGFDDLIIIEKDGLEPTIRLLFTGILAIIFGLLFMKGAVSITLGKLSSNDIKSDEMTAFLIGVILGLNEKIIGNSLTKKTSSLFDNLK